MRANYAHRLMGRLCERPGCSEDAAVAYGMRTEDLVFWLDVLRETSSTAGGVLCQRHGDSMVVPRGWTLDDLRDPDLRLFPLPSRAERAGRQVRRRSVSPSTDGTVQLALGEHVAPTDVEAVADETVVGHADVATELDGERSAAAAHTDVEDIEAWTPSFDDADDLDGLLSARSPLLSRAFRGAGSLD